MAVPMTDAYPWAHAADVGAGGGVDTLALFCRLRKEGAIVFNWATRALTADDDNVTGDRPEAATRKQLHTTVRTLTFHTAAPYDPASRSFCVNLGKPPHLLRDMPGLVPEHALDAAPRHNPGFCTIADAGPAKDTACACVAIIEGVTVENARAQVYVMPREKEPCAQWAAEFTARPALFEHALNKSLVAPTVSLVRGRARPHAYAAYTAATAASPGRAPVRCDVLRAAWFTVRHCTAFRCGLSSGGAASAPFPSAEVCAPHAGAPAYTAADDEEILPYRDTSTTLTALNAPTADRRAVVFRLPYPLYQPLMDLARMAPVRADGDNSSFLAQVGATTLPVECLRLACAILRHVRAAASRADDAVPPLRPSDRAAAFGRDVKWTNELVRDVVTAASAAPAAGATAPSPTGDDHTEGGGARVWSRRAPPPDTQAAGGVDASSTDAFKEANVVDTLSRLNHFCADVVEAAQRLRDALYPVWDAARGYDAQLRWHVSALDHCMLMATMPPTKRAPAQADSPWGDSRTLAHVAATVRVRVRFVHCPPPYAK